MKKQKSEIFWKKLKELREGKGLTQVKLAEILHTTKQSIWNYEIGRTEPNIRTIVSIAEFFHVTTDYLLCNLADEKIEELNTRIEIQNIKLNKYQSKIEKAIEILEL